MFHKLISIALSVISLTPIFQSTVDAEKWTSAFDSHKTAQSISLELNFNPLSLDSIEKISDAVAKFALKSDTTSAEYTASGNYMSSQTDALGNTVNYSYDESKGILLSSTDAKGNQTSYSYDINDRVTNVSQGGISVNYTYDSNNQLSTVTHNGTSYSLIYDALGRSKQTKIGTRLLVDNMYFAESGLLRKAAYGNGNTREYEYDRQGRVKKMIIDGVERFSYTYDSQGNLLSYTDLVANEKFTYVYDFLGRPVQVRTSSGFKIKLTYDEFNRASDVEFVNGTESNKTSWVFGNDSIVTGVKYNGVEKISYTYDLLKRQTKKTVNTTAPFTTSYEYKNIDNYRTSTLIDKISYSDGTALSYTYDANGNILTIKDQSNNILASYTYDSLNQLTGATVGSDVYAYTYDNGGNIVSKTKNGVEVAYTYGNTEWKDLLTAYNGTSISYDTIGNPLNWINGETFTWGGGRQLTGIVKGNDTISYTYNDSGIRTSKTVNGVRTDYYLNGTAIIMQKTGDNVIWYTYDENGLKTGFTYNDTAYYYVYNLQGDVIALLNSAGETVARYDYDPWGKIIAITDGNGVDVSSNSAHIANINPIRYRGYCYDTDTGLYYLQSRYYDAEVGRFLNADAIIGANGYCLFSYCGNNPIMLCDPTGLLGWEGCLWIGGEAIKEQIEIGDIENTAHFSIKDSVDDLVNLINYFGNQSVYDMIAERILLMYEEKYQKEFFANKSEVSFEVRQHIEGYFWAMNITTNKPIRKTPNGLQPREQMSYKNPKVFTAYYYYSLATNKGARGYSLAEYMIQKCEVVDILNFGSKAEEIWFYWFH